MKKIIVAAMLIMAAVSFSSHSSEAQTIIGAYTVSSCGGQTLSIGNPFPLTMDTTGKLCDGASGGGTPASPTSVVGFDSGTKPALGAGASQTPANASHTAGQSVGGLFTIPVARINGGSGAISRFFGRSNGGDVGQLQWKIWDKNPSSTTCTDNAAFVGSATDDLHLIATPFALTPAALSQAQGDAKTYFEQDFTPPASYLNQDTSPSQNIYACAVAVATFTPTAQPYSVDATGYQN